jgi:pimeloyl-ACP methyl ester carboxylesterase
MKTDVILLPGLHGSTALFDTFVALAPPWAKCRVIPLPEEGDQSFDALSIALEPKLRPLEGFVLFGESFAGPIAARLALRLGQKVALLVLCNPLVEAPIHVTPSLARWVIQSPLFPIWPVALAMTGGDRVLAASVLREVRALPKDVFGRRLAAALSADRQDLARRLAAPILCINGSEDRLTSPDLLDEVLADIPFAVHTTIPAPHLAAQIAPDLVWAAITEEFQRAA